MSLQGVNYEARCMRLEAEVKKAEEENERLPAHRWQFTFPGWRCAVCGWVEHVEEYGGQQVPGGDIAPRPGHCLGPGGRP